MNSTGASSDDQLRSASDPAYQANQQNQQQQPPVSFNNVVDFLKDYQRSMYTRETEWLFEKSQMQQRINQLEGQLKAQDNINNDLIKRIKMLEFSLRQERVKYAKLAQGNASIGGTDIIGNVLQKANLNANLYEKIAQRRAKAQRPLLLKFLQEIGYEDIFNSEEINQIKQLYDKAQEEMKENMNNQNYQQEIEEKLMKDENLQKQLAQEERKGTEENENKQRLQILSENDNNIQVKDIQPKFQLRSHMDIVRGLIFVPEIDTLASISEDCTVKLWSMKNLEQLYADTEGNPEPYITLRGHTGPLFSISGPHTQQGRVIFTAGSEGTIRIWNLPHMQEVNQYGDTYDGKNYCIGQWSETSQEVYWDITHHPYSNMLLTVSASNSILVWNTSDLNLESTENPGRILNRLTYLGSSKQQPDLPTSCTWIENNTNQFAVGYKSSTLVFFDNQQSQVINSYQIPHSQQLKDIALTQINKVLSHPSMPLLATAHENGELNLYDFNANKIVKSFQDAHSLSANSVRFVNGGLNMVSGSDDGSIKIWDIRNYKQVAGVKKSHGKKYDEGVMCLACHTTMPFFASGGADCVINIYEVNLQ